MKPGRSILIFAILLTACAPPAVETRDFPPPDVATTMNRLRGRWEGVIEGFDGSDHSFTLLLDEFQPNTDDPQVTGAGGCIAVGIDAVFTPVNVHAETGGQGIEINLFGTAVTGDGGLIMKLSGFIDVPDPNAASELAHGDWRTEFESGLWSASHVARSEIDCPALVLGEELWFFGDVFAGVHDNGGPDQIGFEGFTNIVSSVLRVRDPDGETLDIPYYTDVFSPDIDFVNEYRYLDWHDGNPASGNTYEFTLLDFYGRPITGALSSDTWLDCTITAPRNVTARIDTDGILVEWEAVERAPGFDPGGEEPLGFYQIELNGEGGSYGANGILSTSHLIPFQDFVPPADGSPDGYDLGQSLNQLPEGMYEFLLVAFSAAPSGTSAYRHECVARAESESILFEKSGDSIALPP